MRKDAITVRIFLPWWVYLYIHSCAFFAITFGLTPDFEKIGQRIIKHVKVKPV